MKESRRASDNFDMLIFDNKYIDIFTTKYVINIANMMKILLEKMDYSVTLNVRSINIEDIKIVNQSEDRKMFIFCIQWLVNKDINLPKNK